MKPPAEHSSVPKDASEHGWDFERQRTKHILHISSNREPAPALGEPDERGARVGLGRLLGAIFEVGGPIQALYRRQHRQIQRTPARPIRVLPSLPLGWLSLTPLNLLRMPATGFYAYDARGAKGSKEECF
jgi:hypothetical protein